MKQKRLRIFAGPNGSGKSTLKFHFEKKKEFNFGVYVNADEIERDLRIRGRYNCSLFEKGDFKEPFRQFVLSHGLRDKYRMSEADIEIRNGALFLINKKIDSYAAALIADFIRTHLLEQGESFTYETVLSDERKITFIEKAFNEGYRIYLYFVTTDSPEINIRRVQQRMSLGGHAVDSDKIRERYTKSLVNASKILRFTSRAYLFDTSQIRVSEIGNYIIPELICELTNATELSIKTSDGFVPGWFFEYFLKPLSDSNELSENL
jgi:predicted ABC-type ATPase